MRFTKKVISHCNLWECNCGRVVDQSDRQTDKETDQMLLSSGFLTDSTVNPLVCWFPARARPREPRLAFRLGGGEVAKQFVQAVWVLESHGG